MPTASTITNVFLTLDGRPILDDLTAVLPAGTSGLVAPNGRGKSVLLDVLAGRRIPDRGAVDWRHPVYKLDQLARVDGHRAVDTLDRAGLFDCFQRIEQGARGEHDLAAVDGHWHLPALWRQSLDDAGLHCAPETPAAKLSGGQRRRLALAAAFLLRDHFLLLDEPSNHLDRQGRQWLQERLDRHPGGALVASHDRELLEATGHIFELGRAGLRHYGGNYSFYRRLREGELAGVGKRVETARRQLQQAARGQQQAMERAVKRGRQGERNRGSQSKLLLNARKESAQQSRGKVSQQFAQQQQRLRRQLDTARKGLEQQCAQRLQLARAGLRGGPRLHLQELVLPRGPRREPISLTLPGGARWHVSGSNGCGKSTLLKVIAGELPPAAGICRRSGSCLYLDQEFSLLDREASALANLRRLHADLDDNYWRTALGNMGLRRERALRPLHTLSGGERLKVALLATTRGSRAPDLLLLDEPDNHLDLDSRRLLESALREYPGAFLLVSHDPVFVGAVGIDGELAL
ncbi:ATP-binding cassette domain-containing protein [Microbulbifer sediminum]|uniref:ATP-binding cassette domain-containing protein n=1 Tax=Microbulbifer sediminum TaxID=2904250 RepID=UPI001F012303|nr:ATP-binding cassette domain-containing protein [Microbulbifer sediminum]